MEKIKCTIERVTFQNPENGYSVLQATVKGYRDEQTLVGTFHEVTVGAVLTVEGLGISRRGHSPADDPLRDAPAQPCLYGHHPCEEDLHYRRHHESPGLRHPQHSSAEA